MSQALWLLRCLVRPFDPCPTCGGVFRPAGAGRLECDGDCGQTLRVDQ